MRPPQGLGIPEEHEFHYAWVISQPHSTYVTCHAPPCYIQNATLLTFMPPFISIYMYMFELYISQLHPYEKYRKRQNTDCIFKQLSEKKKSHNRKRKTAVLEFWKNISVKNLLYRSGIPWVSLLMRFRAITIFFSLILKLKCENKFEYIYTTLTLHKYRNDSYYTKYQQGGNKGVGFTTQTFLKPGTQKQMLYKILTLKNKTNKQTNKKNPNNQEWSKSCSVLLRKVSPWGKASAVNSALPESHCVQFKGQRQKPHRASAAQPRPPQRTRPSVREQQ